MKITIDGSENYSIGVEDCQKCGGHGFNILFSSYLLGGEVYTSVELECKVCGYIKFFDEDIING
jgi:predicted nucleic-acid-binding Zn-ribbon protein